MTEFTTEAAELDVEYVAQDISDESLEAAAGETGNFMGSCDCINPTCKDCK